MGRRCPRLAVAGQAVDNLPAHRRSARFLHNPSMSAYALSQILAAIAIAFDLLSFQFRQRRRIIACLAISCLFIASHFALLGHTTATGLALLAAVRLVAGYLTTSKRVMLFFLAATVAMTLCTFNGLLSLCSGLGSMFGTVGSFCRSDRTLRLVMMGATSLWLVHNILAGTPMAVLMEALFLGSNILGYYRFYLRRAGRVED